MTFLRSDLIRVILTSSLVLLLATSISCTLSDQADCNSDEDCAANQTCMRSGGILVQDGVCVDDHTVEPDLDAGVDADPTDTDLPDADDLDADSDITDTELPDTDLPDTDLPDTDLPDTDLPDAADTGTDTDFSDASDVDLSDTGDAGECTTDLDCEQNETCIANICECQDSRTTEEVCAYEFADCGTITDACDEPMECPACTGENQCLENQCVPCITDDHCAQDETCSENECIPATMCNNNNQCGDNQTCTNGFCVCHDSRDDTEICFDAAACGPIVDVCGNDVECDECAGDLHCVAEECVVCTDDSHCSGECSICDSNQCVDENSLCDPPANGSASCFNGTCFASCDNGFGNCDADFSTGCFDLSNNPDYCGSCNISCSSGDSCIDGLCPPLPGSVESIAYVTEPFSGTVLTPCDDCSYEVPIGFSFDFFDETYQSLRVSTNGLLNFEVSDSNSYCCSGSEVPFNGPPNIIAFAWTDLDPRVGEMYYETRGDEPNRRFVVSFVDTPEFPSSTMPGNTIQVILYEGSNSIEIHTSLLEISATRTTTQAIVSPDGTTAYFLDDRNAEPGISLVEDGVRFTTQ